MCMPIYAEHEKDVMMLFGHARAYDMEAKDFPFRVLFSFAALFALVIRFCSIN